ncbi:unnamed protein product [Allacma fusca]|uniref:Uncharacterized protein n=1 Tax=Allacma fusca TaxID=39272 RepID=A0A8J2PBK2_9HEXA|nr:unnamed protein product [Allacma fusca]
MHRLVQKRLNFANQNGKEDESAGSMGTPKKKSKRCCYHDPDWERESEFKDWRRKCTDEEGFTTHMESKKHKSPEHAKTKSNSMKSYVQKSDSPEQLQVIKIEVTSIYHNVVQGHSYNSLDCHPKLVPALFKDSSLAKQVSCALHRMPQIKYFDKCKGIRQGLLDFYEDPYEGSSDIFQKIVCTTTRCGFSFKNVSAYSADNAPVNYGCRNFVYQKLREVYPAILLQVLIC